MFLENLMDFWCGQLLFASLIATLYLTQVLMSVLSTVQASLESETTAATEQDLYEVQECLRLVFTLASEAMHRHNENSNYFRVSLLILVHIYLSLQ